MAFQKPTFSKTQVSQKFDLQDLTGADLTNFPDLKEQIGQAILDRIETRTQDQNVDIRGTAFKAYSAAYRNSDRFADFKSGGSVDMTLRGRMIDDMNVLNTSGNDLEVGHEDNTETLKAFNHNTGDTLPKRQYFGILKKDFDEVIRPFKEELKQIKKDQKGADEQTLGSIFGADTIAEQVSDITQLDLGELFRSLFGDS